MLVDANFTKNLVISGGFIALGLFLPGSTLMDQTAFQANITGIATGIGIGWLIKSFFEKKPAVKAVEE